MWPGKRYPYTSFTNINLDWILRKLKEQISGLVASVNGMTGDVTIPTIPSGGTTGQILAKQTNDDYDTEWITAPSAPVTSVNGNTGAVTVPTIPSGGTTGQILAKQTNDDYDTEWIAAPSAPVTSVNGNTGAVTVAAFPTGGTANQILVKQSSTNYDVAWESPSTALPGWSYIGRADGSNSEIVNLPATLPTELLVNYWDVLSNGYWRTSIYIVVSDMVDAGNANYGGCPPTTGVPASHSFLYDSTYSRFTPDVNTVITVYGR